MAGAGHLLTPCLAGGTALGAAVKVVRVCSHRDMQIDHRLPPGSFIPLVSAPLSIIYTVDHGVEAD
jgi:hypothetical protein